MELRDEVKKIDSKVISFAVPFDLWQKAKFYAAKQGGTFASEIRPFILATMEHFLDQQIQAEENKNV
jgi:hypothetical protein